MGNLGNDLNSATGWVKTHTMLAVALACFIVGAACGHFVHF